MVKKEAWKMRLKSMEKYAKHSGGYHSKGEDVGELGYILSNNLLRLTPNPPQFVDDWEILTLGHAQYLINKGRALEGILLDWGIHKRHWAWFRLALKKAQKHFVFTTTDAEASRAPPQAKAQGIRTEDTL